MVSRKPVKGIEISAQMLAGLDPEHQKRLLDSVAEKDPALAEELRKRLFTFGDFLKLEDQTIQKVLREIPATKLALALRGVPETQKDPIFRNLSSRAGETLREEIEMMGPKPKSEVEAAQAEIVELAKKFRSG